MVMLFPINKSSTIFNISNVEDFLHLSETYPRLNSIMILGTYITQNKLQL